MRDVTARSLAAQPSFEVHGSFDSATQFLSCDLEREPELLLIDCEGEPSAWRNAVSGLSNARQAAKLVLLCQQLTTDVVRCAMDYRVSGVILKSYSAEDIARAIAYMASGRTIMPVGWQNAVPRLRREPLALSPRLRQILALIAQGASNEKIASDLDLSPNTIKFHVRALYARLGVHSRVEAAQLYSQMARDDD